MFIILFYLPRSSILNKDLLLHANPYKTLKNVHTKNKSIWTEYQVCPRIKWLPNKEHGEITENIFEGFLKVEDRI